MINLSEIRIKLFINKIIFNTLNCLKYFIKKKEISNVIILFRFN